MIKEGAELVIGITDILEELNIADVAPQTQKSKKGLKALVRSSGAIVVRSC